MRKINIFIILVVVLLLIAFYNKKNQEQNFSTNGKIIKNKISIKAKSQKTKKEKIIFVPYWALNTSISDDYDRYVYFGISINELGVDKNDDGFRQIGQFIKKTNGKNIDLLIRMIDSRINSRILGNISLQKKIAKDAILIAKENNFNGVVLDFEISALSFDSVIRQITELLNIFSNESKKKGLKFAITLYGDVYFRLRPYDVNKIATFCDDVFIMAYDFHKSSGNPGPNFPFGGSEKYGYDFKRMIKSFNSEVSKEKIVIVFGMFGYDWIVDKKNQSTTSASPISLNQAKQKFVDKCLLTNCIINREDQASEMQVTYQDKNSNQHIVWFEDEVSVKIKENYLINQDISRIGFWAHSYF